MKRTRKLLALVLAMLMAFSLMAVTAAAADAEEHEHTGVCSAETIEPRLPKMQCDTCGATMYTSAPYERGGQYYVDFYCPNNHAPVTGIPYR